jgi:hypothetical protein
MEHAAETSRNPNGLHGPFRENFPFYLLYAAETGSGGVMHIPSFIKIGLGVQKLIRGIHTQKDDLISLFFFFQNKGSWLKVSTWLCTMVDTIK